MAAPAEACDTSELKTQALRRKRALGLSIGSLWLVFAGGGFSTWALIGIGTRAALIGLMALVVVEIALTLIGIRLIGAAARLPGKSAPPAPESKVLRRRFIWIFALEIGAIWVANTILAVLHNYVAIASVDLMIIGAHFLPLARLFHVPRYYLLGGLFCVIPAAVLWRFSGTALVGHANAWSALPSLCCGVAALLIGGAGLCEVWNSL